VLNIYIEIINFFIKDKIARFFTLSLLLINCLNVKMIIFIEQITSSSESFHFVGKWLVTQLKKRY